MKQHAGDGNPLHLASAERGGATIGKLRHVDPRQCLVSGESLSLREAVEGGTQRRDAAESAGKDVVQHGEAADEIAALEDDPHPTAGLAKCSPAGRHHVERPAGIGSKRNPAARGFDEPQDRAKSQRLSRATGPQNADELPPLNLKTDPAQQWLAIRKRLGNPLDVQHRQSRRFIDSTPRAIWR